MPPFGISHQKPKWKCQNENAKGKESGRIVIVGHALSCIFKTQSFFANVC